MRIGLIISNDWELFGDGTGNYFKSQHKPLESLQRIVENHGAQLTVMAEVGQQWAHQRIASHERWALDVVNAWEAMLKEIIRRGHDVQLHLHPQWCDAKYSDGKWEVDLAKWSVSSLDAESILRILKEGKKYLEEILRPVRPSYECLAFRAGDYCIEPSNLVVKSLLEAGILCDTSVTKGMYKPGFFDYRDAHSNILPWLASPQNIKLQASERPTILEIPIYSYGMVDSELFRKFLAPRIFYGLFFKIMLGRHELKWLMERRKFEYERYGISRRPSRGDALKSVKWWFSKVIAKASIQLDYDVLPPKAFWKCIEGSFSNESLSKYRDTDTIVPIMTIGHVKRVHSSENIDHILSLLEDRLKDRLVYWTLADAIKYWGHKLEM